MFLERIFLTVDTFNSGKDFQTTSPVKKHNLTCFVRHNIFSAKSKFLTNEAIVRIFAFS